AASRSGAPGSTRHRRPTPPRPQPGRSTAATNPRPTAPASPVTTTSARTTKSQSSSPARQRERPGRHSWPGTIDKKFFYVKTDFVMRDVVYLDQIEQAEALLKPQRIEVLRQLAEPRSCTEVAVELDQTPQRVYYHVKRLLGARLVRQVAERRVRGIHEGIYQAAGRSYWLSPGLVGRIGLRQTRDRL